MKSITRLRNFLKISQRVFAQKAGISFRSLQLVEGGKHNTSLETLEKIALAFHYPKTLFRKYISHFFELPQDSIAILSLHLKSHPKQDWKILFFNFVDAFRSSKNPSLIAEPPCEGLSPFYFCLVAATVEMLCDELCVTKPWWTQALQSLEEPCFVAGVENLKAMALVESPAYFRKRNIFVLSNFLDRV